MQAQCVSEEEQDGSEASHYWTVSSHTDND
jgi:hypothetical protein